MKRRSWEKTKTAIQPKKGPTDSRNITLKGPKLGVRLRSWGRGKKGTPKRKRPTNQDFKTGSHKLKKKKRLITTTGPGTGGKKKENLTSKLDGYESRGLIKGNQRLREGRSHTRGHTAGKGKNGSSKRQKKARLVTETLEEGYRQQPQQTNPSGVSEGGRKNPGSPEKDKGTKQSARLSGGEIWGKGRNGASYKTKRPGVRRSEGGRKTITNTNRAKKKKQQPTKRMAKKRINKWPYCEDKNQGKKKNCTGGGQLCTATSAKATKKLLLKLTEGNEVLTKKKRGGGRRGGKGNESQFEITHPICSKNSWKKRWLKQNAGASKKSWGGPRG